MRKIEISSRITSALARRRRNATASSMNPSSSAENGIPANPPEGLPCRMPTTLVAADWRSPPSSYDVMRMGCVRRHAIGPDVFVLHRGLGGSRVLRELVVRGLPIRDARFAHGERVDLACDQCVELGVEAVRSSVRGDDHERLPLVQRATRRGQSAASSSANAWLVASCSSSKLVSRIRCQSFTRSRSCSQIS